MKSNSKIYIGEKGRAMKERIKKKEREIHPARTQNLAV